MATVVLCKLTSVYLILSTSSLQKYEILRQCILIFIATYMYKTMLKHNCPSKSSSNIYAWIVDL